MDQDRIGQVISIQIAKENFGALAIDLAGVEIGLCLSECAARGENAERNQQQYLKARSYGGFDNVAKESSRPNWGTWRKYSGKSPLFEGVDARYRKRALQQPPAYGIITARAAPDSDEPNRGSANGD